MENKDIEQGQGSSSSGSDRLDSLYSDNTRTGGFSRSQRRKYTTLFRISAFFMKLGVILTLTRVMVIIFDLDIAYGPDLACQASAKSTLTSKAFVAGFFFLAFGGIFNLFYERFMRVNSPGWNDTRIRQSDMSLIDSYVHLGSSAPMRRVRTGGFTRNQRIRYTNMFWGSTAGMLFGLLLILLRGIAILTNRDLVYDSGSLHVQINRTTLAEICLVSGVIISTFGGIIYNFYERIMRTDSDGWYSTYELVEIQK